MTDGLTRTDIERLLHKLGAQLATDETLYLIGGGALLILGNERSTFDIDYVGNDLPEPSDQLAVAIRKLADDEVCEKQMLSKMIVSLDAGCITA